MGTLSRQLVVILGVGVTFVAIVAFTSWGRERPRTDADQERILVEAEAELGLTARPGDDHEQRFDRIEAKINADLVEKKLQMYRDMQETLGFIPEPSPEQAEFLRKYKDRLPNLVIKKAQPAVDVELIGWPLQEYMTVESCELEGRTLRCLVDVKSGHPLEGWRIRAKAKRLDGYKAVTLAGTSVIAPDLIGVGTSELIILLPGPADMVFLSYQ